MNTHKSTMIKGIFLGTLIMGLVTLWIFSNLAFERFEITLHVIMWSAALYTLYLVYQAYRLRTINPLIWAVLILWVFEELRFNLSFPGF